MAVKSFLMMLLLVEENLPPLSINTNENRREISTSHVNSLSLVHGKESIYNPLERFGDICSVFQVMILFRDGEKASCLADAWILGRIIHI